MALLPNARFIDADEIFDRARRIKSGDEIKRLETGAKATDAAIRHVFERARIGTIEVEMAEGLRTETIRGGADGIAFTVMTTGANSRMFHPVPSTARIQAGDVVRTDFGGYFGAYFGGYLSDLARTAVAGKPTAGQRETYQKLFEVHEGVLRALKPGIRASDAYELCRKSCADLKLDFRSPHIGHNIGISIHEEPMLNSISHDELKPNMVMSIEPIVFNDGFIFHLEDAVLITESGSRPLSDPYRWSELMRID